MSEHTQTPPNQPEIRTLDFSEQWPRIQVIVKGNYHSIIARENIHSGEDVCEFSGEPYDHATAHTLQADENKHILCPGGPVYTNHSCDPCAHFSFRPEEPFPILVAHRDIAAGDEITFDYNTTEWEMSTPFQCLCGSKQCIGLIQGFKHLDRKRQLAVLATGHVAPYIHFKVNEEGLSLE